MKRATPAERVPLTPLAEEIRHSALLLGLALGVMGTFALVLLFLTTRAGG